MKLKGNIVVDQEDDLEKFITDAELAEDAKKSISYVRA